MTHPVEEKQKKAYEHIQWDSDFFGIKIANLICAPKTQQEFESIVADLKRESYKVCYWTFPYNNSECSIIAKNNPDKVVINSDRVTFKANPKSLENTSSFGVTLFNKNSGVNGDLVDLACEAGLYSRFATDKRFGSQARKRLYKEWIESCVRGELADDIFVIYNQQKIAGLIAVKYGTIAKIALVAVGSEYRRQGYGDALISTAFDCAAQKGCSEIEVVTQGDNVQAMSLYKKSGFCEIQRQKVCHIWVDAKAEKLQK